MYKIFIALRYLRAHRIIYFSIAGVALGIAAMVIVTSVMGGFSRDIRARIRGMQADLTLTVRASDLYLPEYEELVEKIRAIPHVKGAAPRLEYSAWITIRGTSRVIQLMGIVPELERGTSDIEDYFHQGSKKQFNFLRESGRKPEHPGIVVGSETWWKTSTKAGLRTVRDDTPPRFLVKDFEIVGWFKSGMTEYDAGASIDHAGVGFTSLESMQAFLDTPSANAIAIELEGYRENVESVRKAVHDVTHEFRACRNSADHERGWCGKYTTKSWEEAKSTLLQAVQVEKGIQIIILFIIEVVAAFIIIAIFTLMVQTKTRDIGILRALGADESGVTTIFLLCGTFCGLVGSIIGIGVGLFLAINLNEITDFVELQSRNLNLTSYLMSSAGVMSAARWVLLVGSFAAAAAALAASVFLFLRRRRFSSAALLVVCGLFAGYGGVAVAGKLDARPLEAVSLFLFGLAIGVLSVQWRGFYKKLDRRQWATAVIAAILLVVSAFFFFAWMDPPVPPGEEPPARAGWRSVQSWIFVGCVLVPLLPIGLQFIGGKLREGSSRFGVYFAGTAFWLILMLVLGGAMGMSAAILKNNPRFGWPGLNLFPKDVYYLERIPVFIDVNAIALIVGFTILVSLISSIYPSRRAASLDPLQAIHEE